VDPPDPPSPRIRLEDRLVAQLAQAAEQPDVRITQEKGIEQNILTEETALRLTEEEFYQEIRQIIKKISLRDHSRPHDMNDMG